MVTLSFAYGSAPDDNGAGEEEDDDDDEDTVEDGNCVPKCLSILDRPETHLRFKDDRTPKSGTVEDALLL